MTVLANVDSEWCLFWAFEVVGLSVVLAIFAAKITGNGDAPTEDDALDSLCAFSSCGVFQWDFVLSSHPTTATVIALVVSSVASRPGSSLAARLFQPPSSKWGVFSLVMVVWGLWAAVASFRRTESESMYSILPLVGCVIFASAASTFLYRRELRLAYAGAVERFRTLDQRPCKYLLWARVVLVVATLVLKAAPLDESTDAYFVAVEVLDAFTSLENLAVNPQLVVGMGLAGMRTAIHLVRAPLDASLSIRPLTRSMLLGWGFNEAFSGMTFLVFDAFNPTDLAEATYDLTESAWKLVVVTFLWGEEVRAFGVAYWMAASFIRNVVIGCGATWIEAAVFDESSQVMASRLCAWKKQICRTVLQRFVTPVGVRCALMVNGPAMTGMSAPNSGRDTSMRSQTMCWRFADACRCRKTR